MDYYKVIFTACLLFLVVPSSYAGHGNCSVPQNCNDCLNYKNESCFWCASTTKCMEHTGFIPKGCKSYDWRLYYGNCTVPGYVWIIVLPLLGLLILAIMLCVICCCCCKCRWSKRSLDKEETKFHRKRMELKAKHDERKAERKLKTDEIRKKYGLYKEDDASTSDRYQKFENDPEV